MMNNLSGGITSKGKLNGSLAIGKGEQGPVGPVGPQGPIGDNNVCIGLSPTLEAEIWFDANDDDYSDVIVTQSEIKDFKENVSNSVSEFETGVKSFKENIAAENLAFKNEIDNSINSYKTDVDSSITSFKNNINSSITSFKNEVNNSNETFKSAIKEGQENLIEIVNKDIFEDSKIDFFGKEHDKLEHRLNADFDNVHQRINESELLPYEGTGIKADNTYYGLQKDTVIKGRTLQNIVKSYKPSAFSISYPATVSEGVFKLPEGESINHMYVRSQANNHLYKPNTTYTVFVDILENTTGKKLGISNIHSMISDKYERDFQNLTGVSCIKITTSTDGLSPQGGAPSLGIYFGIWDANDTSGEFSKYIKFKYWILEGDHTQTPLEELPFIEGIESVGDKSKNLVKSIVADMGHSTGTYVSCEGGYSKRTSIIKLPKGKYSLNFEKFEYTEILDGGIYIWDNTESTSGRRRNPTIKTFEILENEVGITWYGSFKTKERKDEVVGSFIQIEEGETATPYQEYYDGYKISGKSCGRNLFDGIIEEGAISGVSGADLLSDTNNRTGYIRVEPNKDYRFSKNGAIQNSNIYYYSKDKKFLSHETNTTIYTSKECVYIRLSWGKTTVTNEDILQINEGTNILPYEPYKETTYSYILDEPLRSLPNGVCDEIDLTSGVLTRRVGKVVIDGSENWYAWTNIQMIQDTHVAFTLGHYFIGTNYKASNENNLLCNNFAISDNYSTINNSKPYRLCALNNHELYALQFKIEKTALVSADCDGFKQWLQANPTTVYYRLAEPTTEQLTPEQLKSFDSTTHIISDNKLMPIVSTKIHSNVQAIISTLRLENSDLKNNVEVLTVENEELKSVNNVQDEMIDINMLASDELYTLIEPLLVDMLSERGVSKLVDMYVAMVQRGLKTLDEVPARYREQVREILEALEK